MDPRRDTSGDPLALRCDTIAPWLWRVSWRGDAAASERERELLAQVARSRENGALIVLDPESGARTPLPAALLPLTGATAAAFELAALPPAEECGALDLFAPRGRGRVVKVTAKAGAESSKTTVDRLVELLKSKAAIARAQAAIDAAIADFASRDGWRPLPTRRDSLDDGELLPAAATARSFDHATGSDELFVEMAESGAEAQPIAARMVRDSESFTLRLQAGGGPLRARQLVLVRATAPADRGALLRVELDDEDLGPWRLGDAQRPELVSFDLFRISSDLLAGRERIRVALRLDGRPEIAALRWWFLTEEEPEGSWLTELEPARATATGRSDRAGDGGLLVHDDELFLRGLALAPGSEVRYLLPRGERRLVMSVARSRASAAGASLTVTANEETTRLALPTEGRARREFERRVRGDELVLANAGDAEILLLAPRLLR